MVDRKLDELFGLSSDEGAKKADIDRIVRKLEAIVNADVRAIFEEDGRFKSPAKWDENEAAAVRAIRPGAGGLGYSIDWQDTTRAAEALAKIKGLYRNEDENENPLASALARIPREELIELAAHLRRLGDIEDSAAA